MDPLFYQAFLAFDSGRYDEAERFYALALAKYPVSQYEQYKQAAHGLAFTCCFQNKEIYAALDEHDRAKTCFSLSGQAFKQAGNQVAAEEVRRFDMALGCTGGDAGGAAPLPAAGVAGRGAGCSTEHSGCRGAGEGAGGTGSPSG